MEPSLPDLTPEEVEAHKTQWALFRPACFARYGSSAFWVWSAGQPCDFYVVALATMRTPGFWVELIQQAVCITVFDEQHLIPLAQMTPQSMHDLQFLVKESNCKAFENLRDSVHRAHDLDGPPADLTAVLH